MHSYIATLQLSLEAVATLTTWVVSFILHTIAIGGVYNEKLVVI